jgi:AmmeMemoRadiSam system protein A
MMSRKAPTQKLSPQEKTYLLTLARNAIVQATNHQPPPDIVLEELTESLRENGATFVTLMKDRQLRGCIGALEAYQPLAMDVREHAVAAALEDYRFPPVSGGEVASITIEISRLTRPEALAYEDARALIRALRPGLDGVILIDGPRRATFLPQVWEQLPNPEDFLAHLCHKMGTSPDTWQKRHLTVSTYQVEEFHE